jgi:hypothetical protein
MRRVTTWITAAALGLAAAVAAPPSALASPSKPKIDWVRVDVPEGLDAGRLGKVLREALKQASKHANFGKAPRTVTLSARVTEFTTEVHGDVLQVSCTVMGRVAGGAGARSRISYGGSPEDRGELEKQVLTMVANGLVARLAQIVRTQAPKVR